MERYVIANTIWGTNKTVKFEKLVKELKCCFAIKKNVQQLVDWNKVVRYVVGSIKIIKLEPGNYVTLDPKLRHLLLGLVVFTSSFGDMVLRERHFGYP